jgi:hypothetical protein
LPIEQQIGAMTRSSFPAAVEFEEDQEIVTPMEHVSRVNKETVEKTFKV